MRVAAVVVTYNRKDLLREGLSALLAQTRSFDEIIVVDNDSSDGTDAVVENEFPHVTYLRLPENLGGAGGFYAGIKTACEEDYDWVWCADDDGFPAPDALEKLLTQASEDVVWANCLVVSKQEPDRLALALPLVNSRGFPRFWGRKRFVKLLSELGAYSDDGKTLLGANTLNGSLLSVKAVKEVGNVKRELFIWGDDVELMCRMAKVGRVLTVLDAFQYHPDILFLEVPAWKLYYGLRNSIYICNRYLDFPLLRTLERIARSVPVFCQSSQGVRLFVRAIVDGYRGNLHGRVRPDQGTRQ